MMRRHDFDLGKFVSANFGINNHGRIFQVARFENIVIRYFCCCKSAVGVNINVSAVLGSKLKQSSNIIQE